MTAEATLSSVTFRITKDGETFTVTLRTGLLGDHFQRAEQSPKHEALLVKGALRIHHVPKKGVGVP